MESSIVTRIPSANHPEYGESLLVHFPTENSIICVYEGLYQRYLAEKRDGETFTDCIRRVTDYFANDQ